MLSNNANDGTPTPGKTTPDAYAAFLRDVIECPCGVPHSGAHLEALAADALGRMHMARWLHMDVSDLARLAYEALLEID